MTKATAVAKLVRHFTLIYSTMIIYFFNKRRKNCSRALTINHFTDH